MRRLTMMSFDMRTAFVIRGTLTGFDVGTFIVRGFDHRRVNVTVLYRDRLRRETLLVDYGCDARADVVMLLRRRLR